MNMIIKSMKLVGIACFVIWIGKANAQTSFKIITPSNPRITTHQLNSGKLTIGITENGGGVINQLIIPGIGDIMDIRADMYGRSGQSSIRDKAHGGRYNPTQAGFNEQLGTRSPITKKDNILIVEPRGCALWHGDGGYDFTEWENIGPDPYKDDQGNTDIDSLKESNLRGKQETEVFSEFDYYGTYENYVGKYGIKTAAIRHYFEYRFIREPGHCLNQFRTGTKAFVPRNLADDISVKFPKGTFKATDKDMSGLIPSWSIRNDLAIWKPLVRFVQTNDGKWETESREDIKVFESGKSGLKEVFIVAESEDINTGNALGFYRPSSEINTYSVIGINEKDGSINYKDNRTVEANGLEMMYRIPTMSWMGFRQNIKGLINRTRLPKGVYEAFREEVFFLYGTPKEIMDAIETLDKQIKK
jgi:hypothetical protein